MGCGESFSVVQNVAVLYRVRNSCGVCMLSNERGCLVQSVNVLSSGLTSSTECGYVAENGVICRE